MRAANPDSTSRPAVLRPAAKQRLAATGGKSIDCKLWFSDTFVRTPAGWRYAPGQASLPLPAAP